MSTSAPTDEETRSIMTKLADLFKAAPDPDPVLEALSALVDEHGDEALANAFVAMYPDDETPSAPVTKTAVAKAVTVDMSGLEAKIDALIKVVTALASDESDEEGSEPATPVAKASEATTTVPKSKDVRETLLKSGVPGPLIELAAPALESADENAAAAARGLLAKFAGTTDLAQMLKEHGTAEGSTETPKELDEATKKAAAAMVAGL